MPSYFNNYSNKAGTRVVPSVLNRLTKEEGAKVAPSSLVWLFNVEGTIETVAPSSFNKPNIEGRCDHRSFHFQPVNLCGRYGIGSHLPLLFSYSNRKEQSIVPSIFE